MTVPISVSSDKSAHDTAILAALASVGVTPKSITHESNVSAFVGFMNSSEVSSQIVELFVLLCVLHSTVCY